MPSLLESVTTLLDEGDALDKLGGLIGGDKEQAQSASGLAVPLILDGLASRAAQDGGPDVVINLLDADDGSALEDVSGFFDRGDDQAGTGILDGIFGPDRDELIGGLASKAEMGGSMITKLLPMLAPVVIGTVGKRRGDDGLDIDGIAALLAAERETMAGRDSGGSSDGSADGVIVDADEVIIDLGTTSAGAGSSALVIGAAAEEPAGDPTAADAGDAAVAIADDDTIEATADEAEVEAGDAEVVAAAVDVAEVDADDAIEATAGDAEVVAADIGEDEATQVGEDEHVDVLPVAETSRKAAPKKTVGASAEKAVTGTVTDLKPAVVSGLAGRIDAGRAGADHDGRPRLGWLWWALGAVVLVLLLAWLLSTCNEETAEADPVAARSEADADADADADAGDTALTAANDGDETGGESGDGESGDGGAVTEADLQAAVDAALSGSGVTGTVAGGAVTLTGAVGSEQIGADATAEIERLAGVTSVSNETTVGQDTADSSEAGGSESDSTGTDGTETDRAASDGGEEAGDGEGGLVAGSTINELLDLDSVTFAISSARITPEGLAVLDEAAGFLVANPQVRVEIGGHTDNDGTEAENLALSQRRAESVKEYLESQGIDGDRMEPKGYGEAEPLVPNDSSLAKAENRRIEFTIL